MWKISVSGTPSVEDCPCFDSCCAKSGSAQPTGDSAYLDNMIFSGCEKVSPPCGGSNQADCGGAVQTKDVESIYEFPDCWKKYKPIADVSGIFDNYGSVGALQSSDQGTNSCALGRINGQTAVQTSAGSTGKFKMKVTVTSNNSAHGGPHGARVSIFFHFEDPIPVCDSFTSLPPLTDCPNNPGSCPGGGGGNYTGMNFFPIGPGNAMAFV